MSRTGLRKLSRLQYQGPGAVDVRNVVDPVTYVHTLARLQNIAYLLHEVAFWLSIRRKRDEQLWYMKSEQPGITQF